MEDAMLVGNAIVGQSGGPTSAINATLCGVIEACAKNEKIQKLYGMQNGIEGFLNETIIDLSYLFGDQNSLDILKTTPAAALGSCRRKLKSSKEYEQIFALFAKYNIRYFFYIGGNDSMDTVLKLSEYAKHNSYDIRIIGIPKTIDNDLQKTDHTPGFGSAAKYIATTIKEIATDCEVYTKKAVTIVELMGRDAGWLTASAGLPAYFGYTGAKLIYLPEIPFSNEAFIASVKAELEKHPSLVVAVSEGVRYENGHYVGEGTQSGMFDEFGHKYLAGTARVLEALVKKEIGCKVRSVELNLPQRCSAHILSATDINESIQIGAFAVESATRGESAKMAIFVRTGNYSIGFDLVDIKECANIVKHVPKEFINQDGNNVTKECLEYIAPLILGEMNIKYENGIPAHLSLK
jgi:6-phosphofructokinase 1